MHHCISLVYFLLSLYGSSSAMVHSAAELQAGYVCEYVLRGIHVWPPPPPIRLTSDASWYAYALLASSGVPRRDLLRPALALETVTFQKDFK